MMILLSNNVFIYSAGISLFKGGGTVTSVITSDLRVSCLFGPNLIWYLGLYSYIY